jgi:hypothetical protein
VPVGERLGAPETFICNGRRRQPLKKKDFALTEHKRAVRKSRKYKSNNSIAKEKQNERNNEKLRM